MKSLSRLLAFSFVTAQCGLSVAQDKAESPDDIAARAADARRAAASSDPSITETLNKLPDGAAGKLQSAANKVTTPSKKVSIKGKGSNPDDPATWGKNEIHKLAVMELKFGSDIQTIVFELFESDAPRTVSNFADNCASGAYNGLAIHRTIDSYLVQTGDPTSANDSARDRWGTGGEDKAVPAEIKRPHKLGSVAMARRSDKVNPEKKSNGFQFYFALGNMSALNGQYTVFGQVVTGIDWLERISRVPADSNDCPLERIEVKSIKVVEQKGPLTVVNTTNTGKRRLTKPDAAKSKLVRFIERIW